jgi:hypothetical protein
MKMRGAKQIPVYFKPILWSYDFGKLDLEKNERDIILSTINYGDLIHWFWILENYGKDEVKQIIKQSRLTQLRPGARRLAELIFEQNNG